MGIAIVNPRNRNVSRLLAICNRYLQLKQNRQLVDNGFFMRARGNSRKGLLCELRNYYALVTHEWLAVPDGAKQTCVDLMVELPSTCWFGQTRQSLATPLTTDTYNVDGDQFYVESGYFALYESNVGANLVRGVNFQVPVDMRTFESGCSLPPYNTDEYDGADSTSIYCHDNSWFFFSYVENASSDGRLQVFNWPLKIRGESYDDTGNLAIAEMEVIAERFSLLNWTAWNGETPVYATAWTRKLRVSESEQRLVVCDYTDQGGVINSIAESQGSFYAVPWDLPALPIHQAVWSGFNGIDSDTARFIRSYYDVFTSERSQHYYVIRQTLDYANLYHIRHEPALSSGPYWETWLYNTFWYDGFALTVEKRRKSDLALVGSYNLTPTGFDSGLQGMDFHRLPRFSSLEAYADIPPAEMHQPMTRFLAVNGFVLVDDDGDEYPFIAGLQLTRYTGASDFIDGTVSGNESDFLNTYSTHGFNNACQAVLLALGNNSGHAYDGIDATALVVTETRGKEIRANIHGRRMMSRYYAADSNVAYLKTASGWDFSGALGHKRISNTTVEVTFSGSFHHSQEALLLTFDGITQEINGTNPQSAVEFQKLYDALVASGLYEVGAKVSLGSGAYKFTLARKGVEYYTPFIDYRLQYQPRFLNGGVAGPSYQDDFNEDLLSVRIVDKQPVVTLEDALYMNQGFTFREI